MLFIMSAFGLASCAAGPSLQSRMAVFIGQNSQTLVQKLGVPDKQITTNGIQYLAYSQHHEEVEPNDFGPGFYSPFAGSFMGGGFYGGGFDAGFPQQVDEYSCETTFMLKNDRVFNFTLRGNDCG